MFLSLSIAMGLMSPGKTSPVQGPIAKEYEDQLIQLRNEVSDLESRIVFLEEKVEHLNVNDDEDPMKNIDSKVKCSFSLKVCFLMVCSVSLMTSVTTAKKQT
jgi:hypothetical protein